MELRAELSLILGLQPFERFVLVMSVFERYSDRECTLLLGCTRASLISARNRALQQIARDDQPSTLNLQSEPLHSKSNSGLELQSPVPLATPA
jgi:hypothetical protein